MNTLRFALMLALCAAPAMAQVEATASPSPTAPAAAPAPASPFAAPEPAAEMEQMRRWEGTFKTQATFVKGAMLAEGGEAKGTYTIKRGLRGHAYVGEYKASGSGGEFEARSMRMWDPVTRKWKTWWFDSWVPGHATVSIGEVQADGTFVNESESESADRKYKMRMTERWPDDNKIEQVYEADHGDGWKTVMTIAYTRKGKWKEPKAKPAAQEKEKDADKDARPKKKKKKAKKDEPEAAGSSVADPKEQEEKAATEAPDED